MHPNQITTWKAQLVDGAAEVFGSKPKAGLAAPAIDVKPLHAKLGGLTLITDRAGDELLSGALGKSLS